jgi:hypothetical protein
MSYSPGLGGIPGAFVGLGGSEFAPASFGDAEEARPLSAMFDIGGHAASTPYTTAVQAMLAKHTAEIRGKADVQLQLSIGDWKKRLREFLTRKHGELLGFLGSSVSSHPALSQGEILLRRFSNPAVAASPQSHPSVRDLVLDCSGEDVMADIGEALTNFREADCSGGPAAGVQAFAAQMRLLFEEYRSAGEAVTTAQTALMNKLAGLDRVQGKLAHLFEIEPNTKWEPLMEATEAYLSKIYTDNAIEAEYNGLIAAYRRFATLREILLTTRMVEAHEHGPMCSICLGEPVGYCLTPCGHTFCGSCVRRQGASCPFCRAHIKERVKLYFG